MKDCSPNAAPIMKGDKFDLNQCPKNKLEWEQMHNIPYASIVGSLMYLTATQLDIMHVISPISRYMECPRELHLCATKRIL